MLDLMAWMLAGWAALSGDAKMKVEVSSGYMGHQGPGH